MAQRSVWGGLTLVLLLAVCSVRSLGAQQDAAMRDALAAYRKRDLPTAERLFRQIVTREPANRVARFSLGNALFYQHKYQPAIDVYAPLLDEELKDPQLAKLLEDHPAYALAIHDAAPAGAPAGWFSRSYNAYFLSGDYCLDLHLSADNPDQATEAKMRAVVESLKVEPLPPLEPLFLKEEAKPAPQPPTAP